jgi:HK97 gp10 family phage protein
MAARQNNAGAIQEHIKGLREAKAAFQALPQLMRERMNVATETTLSEIVRHAKGRITSSPSIQTRSLLNAIGYSLNKNNGRGRAGVGRVTTTLNLGGRKVRVRGIVVAGKDGSALTSAGAKLIKPTRYAHLVEFGSRHMKAEPFMLPAAKSQEQPYLERASRAGKEVERDMAAIGMRNQ